MILCMYEYNTNASIKNSTVRVSFLTWAPTQIVPYLGRRCLLPQTHLEESYSTEFYFFFLPRRGLAPFSILYSRYVYVYIMCIKNIYSYMYIHNYIYFFSFDVQILIFEAFIVSFFTWWLRGAWNWQLLTISYATDSKTFPILYVSTYSYFIFNISFPSKSQRIFLWLIC
jgi:hypothetical protein